MFQRAVMSKPTPLPRFRSYRDVTRSCAHIIRPKPHMAGSGWASRYLNYDFGALPWHAELLDALTDPMTAEVALIGPSQTNGAVTASLRRAARKVEVRQRPCGA